MIRKKDKIKKDDLIWLFINDLQKQIIFRKFVENVNNNKPEIDKLTDDNKKIKKLKNKIIIYII